MNAPELNKKVTMSWGMLAGIVFGVFTVTTTYWNLTRTSDRLDKLTDRNRKFTIDQVNALRLEMKNELKHLQKEIALEYQEKEKQRNAAE